METKNQSSFIKTVCALTVDQVHTVLDLLLGQ